MIVGCLLSCVSACFGLYLLVFLFVVACPGWLFVVVCCCSVRICWFVMFVAVCGSSRSTEWLLL